MYVYEFPITAALGKLIDRIGELEKSINGNMRTFGHVAELQIRSEIGRLLITTLRPLTKAQEGEIVKYTQESYDKMLHLKAAQVRVGSPRRKSSKSGSQSTANK